MDKTKEVRRGYVCDDCHSAVDVRVNRVRRTYLVSLPRGCPKKDKCEKHFLTKIGFATIQEKQ